MEEEEEDNRFSVGANMCKIAYRLLCIAAGVLYLFDHECSCSLLQGKLLKLVSTK